MKKTLIVLLTMCLTMAVSAKEDVTYLPMTERFEYSEDLPSMAKKGNSDAMWNWDTAIMLAKALLRGAA